MIVTLAEGNMSFIGDNAADIIAQLKLDDWVTYENKLTYKKNMARRVRLFHGKRIKYQNDEEFLQELQRVGFIRSIEK